MSKALIIAEKPSVAADIAKALGGFTREGEYFESEDYVISSAVGHLLEITAPEEFEVKRGKWSFAHLPVIPSHFDLRPITRGEDRLKVLTRLIKRKDVTELINACDAGREGELIFRLIAQHAKAKQPVKRLWLQSMTPTAIREAFKSLRTDVQMRPLADAARCRSEADWLVGINGTRAMTAFNSRDGGFYLTTVGRVQTPTLTIVVEREERIKRFISRDYFEVKATFKAKAGTYEGRWFDTQFKKGEDAEARAERLWDRPSAEAIADLCRGKPGQVTEEAKPTTQISPALFDLTTLQREANGRFGFSAKTTLSIAQALYEKHKVLTYPRTDSRALPEDYMPTVKSAMEMLNDSSNPANPYAPFAGQILSKGWIKPNKRIFDNTKVSDHFAIIPTLQEPKSLSDAEQKIYDMVTRRFLSVFFPPAEYMVTTRITLVESHSFKTEGRVLTNPGWLAIYGRASSEAGGDLVPVEPKETVSTESVDVNALATKPPPRYSEATLLSAMEGAGKLVEDDELREAMAAKGLGTPATRAAIIEGLISDNYLIREGRELVPTTKAFQLLTLLRGLDVPELTMPELTGGWEHKLALMERGQLDRDEFMREIAEMARQVVERAKNYKLETVPGDYATLTTPCPKCGHVVKENYRRFACTNCDFSISKTPGSRQLEVAEAEELLREKTVGPLQGFRSRLGRPFAAILKITPEFKLEFDFGQSNEDSDGEPIDFSAQTALGKCPKCADGLVYEHGMSYVCNNSVKQPKTCDFRSGKIILQQEIAPEQMSKLLTEGRTDLLQGFVSSRTRRKFKAYLVRGKDGKVSFEFEPRPVKPGAAAKAAAKADADGTDGVEPDGDVATLASKTTKATKATKAARLAPDKASASAPIDVGSGGGSGSGVDTGASATSTATSAKPAAKAPAKSAKKAAVKKTASKTASKAAASKAAASKSAASKAAARKPAAK